MGIYDKLKNTVTSKGSDSSFFEDGIHVVKLDRVVFDKNMNDLPYFVAECTILKTSSDAPSMQPGRAAKWMTTSDKKSYFSNIKKFITNCYGCEEAEFDALSDADGEKLMDSITGQGQLFAGKLFQVTATYKPEDAAKQKREFTFVSFRPVDEADYPKYL